MSQLVQQELERLIESLSEFMVENDMAEIHIKPTEERAFVVLKAEMREVELCI
jgi:hypothetical protein